MSDDTERRLRAEIRWYRALLERVASYLEKVNTAADPETRESLKAAAMRLRERLHHGPPASEESLLEEAETHWSPTSRGRLD